MLPHLFLILALALTIDCICTRHDLAILARRYITAQSTGSPSWISPLFNELIIYTENLLPKPVPHITNSTTLSILNHALKIDHVLTLLDTTSCATYTELIASSPVPYIIGTQIHFSIPIDSNGTVTILSIDSIVTTRGDLFFSNYTPSHALHHTFLEDWSPLPTALLTPRTTLLTAANAYYDYFTNHSISVPWGTPCTRLEGGYLTASSNCSDGIPDPAGLTRTGERKVVVDEVLGAVSGLSNFGGLGADVHLFRVVEGRIRGIRSMTSCGEVANCGLDMPGQLGVPVGF